MTKPLHRDKSIGRSPASVKRNPSVLRIDAIEETRNAAAISPTQPFSVDPRINEKVNDIHLKPNAVANNRPLEDYHSAVMSPITGLSPEDTIKMLNSIEKRNREQERFNWDAVLASLEKGDREDLTSSSYRQFKYRFQNAFNSGEDIPSMSGEEFNREFPPNIELGEAPIKPKAKLNYVQRDMILSARDENRKLTQRIAKGKDNALQSVLNFTAETLGAANVGDIAMAFLAPQAEAYLLGARWFPKVFKPSLKAIQAARSGTLKKKAAIAAAENLAVEGVTIPMEQLDREATGLEQFDAMDIGIRAIGGVLFSMGLSSLAHVLGNSKYWMNYFEENFPEAVKEFVRHFVLMKEGVPYDPVVMGKTWNDMTIQQRQNWVEKQLQPSPDAPPVSDIPTLEKSEEALTNKINSLLHEEYIRKKEKFDALENKEGVEPPRQETYKTIIEDYDAADVKIQEQLKALANCLTKG
jgi:hypothetical protein